MIPIFYSLDASDNFTRCETPIYDLYISSHQQSQIYLQWSSLHFFEGNKIDLITVYCYNLIFEDNLFFYGHTNRSSTTSRPTPSEPRPSSPSCRCNAFFCIFLFNREAYLFISYNRKAYFVFLDCFSILCLLLFLRTVWPILLKNVCAIYFGPIARRR